MRMVRCGLAPIFLRMRTASIITATPAPLSAAPVPVCQESMCAPSITTSLAFDPAPGISRDGVVAVAVIVGGEARIDVDRSEEHTSELQSLMRISYAVFCLKKKTHTTH